jgi:hypothetical protein
MNEKPLFSLTPVTPRPGLLQQVLFAVQHRQQASRLWRLRVAASIGIASIVALVPVGISLVHAFAASNFADYVSLLFSDTAIALSSWKVIGASLLESLPVLALTSTLALVGLLVYSLRSIGQSISTRPIMSNV